MRWFRRKYCSHPQEYQVWNIILQKIYFGSVYGYTVLNIHNPICGRTWNWDDYSRDKRQVNHDEQCQSCQFQSYWAPCKMQVLAVSSPSDTLCNLPDQPVNPNACSNGSDCMSLLLSLFESFKLKQRSWQESHQIYYMNLKLLSHSLNQSSII
jgi:hypothetical protein